MICGLIVPAHEHTWFPPDWDVCRCVKVRSPALQVSPSHEAFHNIENRFPPNRVVTSYQFEERVQIPPMRIRSVKQAQDLGRYV